MTFCSKCGATVRVQAQFCSVCGEKISPVALPAISSGQGAAATILMSGQAVGPGAAAYLITHQGQKILAQASMTIGRDPQHSTVFIDDGRMSRKHALLEDRQGQWILTDLNSANGTYVNGQPITAPTPIHAGDQIQMGDTSLSLHLPGQPAAPLWNTPVISPVPVNPSGTPEVPVPYGGWQNWQQTPLAEGRVEHIDRHTMKRDDLMQRGCVAVLLGLIAAPLVFLPFIQGSDQNVLNIRVADAHAQKMVDVKVMGDLYGVVSQGDIIAVWGKPQKGLFIMQRAYNYTTGHDIAVRK